MFGLRFPKIWVLEARKDVHWSLNWEVVNSGKQLLNLDLLSILVNRQDILTLYQDLTLSEVFSLFQRHWDVTMLSRTVRSLVNVNKVKPASVLPPLTIECSRLFTRHNLILVYFINLKTITKTKRIQLQPVLLSRYNLSKGKNSPIVIPAIF